jgi:hypothetical protein
MKGTHEKFAGIFCRTNRCNSINWIVKTEIRAIAKVTLSDRRTSFSKMESEHSLRDARHKLPNVPGPGISSTQLDKITKRKIVITIGKNSSTVLF